MYCQYSIDSIFFNAAHVLTLGVLDDSGVHALHESDGGVGGTQVDTDDGALNLLIAVDLLGV